MRIQQMLQYVNAGYAFFYIQAPELGKAAEELNQAIATHQKKDGSTPYRPVSWNFEYNNDPDAVIEALGDGNEPETIPVMIAQNWHWFLSDEYGKPEYRYIQWLINREVAFTQSATRKLLFLLGKDSFSKAIPAQVANMFMPLEYDLPGPESIEQQLQFIIKSAERNPSFKKPEKPVEEALIRAALGLSTIEAQNAFAYSLISTGGMLDPVVVSELKAKEVEKTPGLKIGRYKQSIENLKGYDVLKKFVLSTIKSPLSKGVILLGPPGTGKSTFAMAIGKASGRLVFELEVAELFGGLVGDTEKLVREAIAVIKANAPCVLFVDELEKALAGSGSGSSSTDGGTTKRAMAQFLKFLSNRTEEGIYVIATCNDIGSLDPEWIRPGRWDSSPFFVGLPDAATREEIWEQYAKAYQLKAVKVKDEGWTGAEIESCCRIAAMMNTDVKSAQAFILPISKTMGAKIAALNEWAKDRTISAADVAAKVKTASVRELDI